MGRSQFRALAAILVAGLIVAACGGNDDTTTASDDTATEQTATTETTASDDTTTTETTTTGDTADEGVPPEASGGDGDDGDQGAEGTLIEVRVTGDQVEGGGRTPVPLGDTVTIRVTSDVADHVHLHGYDVLADVAAGQTAELVFTADIPGVFEVELEDAGLLLLELEIS